MQLALANIPPHFVPRTGSEPKVCKCGGVALRYVGKRGFCKDHIADAFAAASEEALNSALAHDAGYGYAGCL